MNAVDFLKAHHRQLERAFARLDLATPEQTARAFERLADALATHFRLEDHLCTDVAGRNGDEVLRHLQGSYTGIARIMGDLLQRQAKDETFASRLRILRAFVRRHIRLAEGEVFPRAKQLLSEGELAALGHDLESELIRLYARGIPRRLFESEGALVSEQRAGSDQSGGLEEAFDRGGWTGRDLRQGTAQVPRLRSR